MSDTAKIFTNGGSQAVRLPAGYRFDGKEVYIRRDPATGDVILSGKPTGWHGLFAALDRVTDADDFLVGRDQGEANRDPLDGRGADH